MNHQITKSSLIGGRSLLVFFCFAISLSSGVFAAGGIVTDGTVGAPGNLGASHTLSGGGNTPEMVTVTQAMGSTAGTNLFHSFSEFNIASGQKVTFTEDKAGFIQNVIARVTGNEASHIHGTLSVTPEGKANFYLLNPNGVLFGNGAQIDVPGDFHVTTATYVKFQDGAKYGADPVTSRLSSSAPSAFGFTEASKSTNVLIEVRDGAQLQTKNANSAIDLVGSHIAISNAASIFADKEGAQIRLVAVKGKHEIRADKDESGYLALPNEKPNRSNAGDIILEAGGGVRSQSDSGGRIGIWASSLGLSDRASLILINAGSVDPSIRDGLHVLANLISIRDESSISSTSLSSGKGSDINLSILDRIEIESNIKNGFTTGIYSLAKGSGRGGNIDIRSGSLVMVGSDNDNPSVIRSTSDGGGSGGDILMGLRGDLLMTKDAIIGAYAIDSLKSGDIAIKVGADLKIRDRSSITSQAYSENSEGIYSYGETGGIKVAAGNILISYKDQLLSPINTGIFNFNKNESGLVGAVDVSSRGSINILGGYGFGGTADKLLGAYVGIVSISHLKYSPSAPGGIYVRAANRINMRGFGPEEPSDAPAFLRFRYPVVITGILSSLDGMSDIPPPSIHVFSGGGISLFQSGILSDGQMKNPSSLPSINLKTPGNVSLYRSEISNGIGVDSFSQAGNNAAVSVSAGNILIQDKSDVSSNVPGHGINLESSGGIHISSNTVNLNFGKDLIRRSYPDFSVFYNGFYGSGGINIKAKDNITLFNASIGAQKSTASESRSIMNISVSAENFTFIESSVGVVNPGDISDYSNSNIKFYSRGLFPLFNVVNGRFYTDDGGLNEKSAPLRPYGLNNKIFKSGSGVYSEKIAISGTLLGISGFMPTLNPPQFESNARGNACQTYKSGDLSITGKGRLGDPMGYLLH